MNVKAIWLPLALLVSMLTSTADAQGPALTVRAATIGAPDLCAELDQYGHPARCKPVGPEMAPYWHSDVCCNADQCTETGRTSGCAPDMKRYWCESAVLYSDGTLDCVYEVPAYCDVYPCGPADITAPPVENALCCYESGCYDAEGGLCGGDLLWCGSGVSNDDGTVTCLDGEDGEE